jgi:hypothetical protein
MAERHAQRARVGTVALSAASLDVPHLAFPAEVALELRVALPAGQVSAVVTPLLAPSGFAAARALRVPGHLLSRSDRRAEWRAPSASCNYRHVRDPPSPNDPLSRRGRAGETSPLGKAQSRPRSAAADGSAGISGQFVKSSPRTTRLAFGSGDTPSGSGAPPGPGTAQLAPACRLRRYSIRIWRASSDGSSPSGRRRATTSVLLAPPTPAGSNVKPT